MVGNNIHDLYHMLLTLGGRVTKIIEEPENEYHVYIEVQMVKLVYPDKTEYSDLEAESWIPFTIVLKPK